MFIYVQNSLCILKRNIILIKIFALFLVITWYVIFGSKHDLTLVTKWMLDLLVTIFFYGY